MGTYNNNICAVENEAYYMRGRLSSGLNAIELISVWINNHIQQRYRRPQEHLEQLVAGAQNGVPGLCCASMH